MNPVLVMLSEAGDKVYGFGEATGIALFTWAVVFAVLFLIFVIITVFGKVVGSLSKEKTPEKTVATPAPVAAADAGEEFSSGSLKLKGCDEKTAAMIMAIVSDNTGIPLSELIFKSITLVEK